MKNIEKNLQRIEEIVLETICQLELLEGYCQYKSDSIDEMNNLLTVLSLVINSHKELYDIVDNLGLSIGRIIYADILE